MCSSTSLATSAYFVRLNTTLQRILDGFFQALAVRSAGFNIIDVSQTAPSLQVLYIIVSGGDSEVGAES